MQQKLNVDFKKLHSFVQNPSFSTWIISYSTIGEIADHLKRQSPKLHISYQEAYEETRKIVGKQNPNKISVERHLPEIAKLLQEALLLLEKTNIIQRDQADPETLQNWSRYQPDMKVFQKEGVQKYTLKDFIEAAGLQIVEIQNPDTQTDIASKAQAIDRQYASWGGSLMSIIPGAKGDYGGASRIDKEYGLTNMHFSNYGVSSSTPGGSTYRASAYASNCTKTARNRIILKILNQLTNLTNQFSNKEMTILKRVGKSKSENQYTMWDFDIPQFKIKDTFNPKWDHQQYDILYKHLIQLDSNNKDTEIQLAKEHQLLPTLGIVILYPIENVIEEVQSGGAYIALGSSLKWTLKNIKESPSIASNNSVEIDFGTSSFKGTKLEFLQKCEKKGTLLNLGISLKEEQWSLPQEMAFQQQRRKLQLQAAYKQSETSKGKILVPSKAAEFIFDQKGEGKTQQRSRLLKDKGLVFIIVPPNFDMLGSEKDIELAKRLIQDKLRPQRIEVVNTSKAQMSTKDTARLNMPIKEKSILEKQKNDGFSQIIRLTNMQKKTLKMFKTAKEKEYEKVYDEYIKARDNLWKIRDKSVGQAPKEASSMNSMSKFAAKLKIKGYTKFAQQVEQAVQPSPIKVDNLQTEEKKPYRVWDSENLVMEPSDISNDQELDNFLDVLYEDLQEVNSEYAEHLTETVFGTPTNRRPVKFDTVIKKTTARDWHSKIMDKAKSRQ